MTSNGDIVTTHPDLLLARRAAKADPSAWDEIVARYGERIFNLARRFATSRGEAEDLTQDVFLKLYANLSAYRGEMPLIAWALRLSRNLCIDHYRRHRRRYQSETVSDEILQFQAGDDDPHQHSWLEQRRALVHQTLAEMNEDHATIIVLRDLQGMSYDDVAHVLELPVGTVKSRLNRARRELMHRLTERLSGQPNGGSSGASDPDVSAGRRSGSSS